MKWFSKNNLRAFSRFQVHFPRLSQHPDQDGRGNLHIVVRLVNDLEGDKELSIFWSTDIGDHLEERILRIFIHLNPRLRKVWPDVIDDQEETLVAGIVHWVEREAERFGDEDLTMVKVEFVCLSYFRRVEVSRHESRKATGNKVLQQRRLEGGQAVPLRSKSEMLVGLKSRGSVKYRFLV
jgi:hypothetical protein